MMETNNRFRRLIDYLYGTGIVVSATVAIYPVLDNLGSWFYILDEHEVFIPAFMAGGFGLALASRFQKRRLKKIEAEILRLQKDSSYNPYQQNLETQMEQYQQPAQGFNQTYQQPAQELYQNPTDLEAQIAQLRNEINELESN